MDDDEAFSAEVRGAERMMWAIIDRLQSRSDEIDNAARPAQAAERIVRELACAAVIDRARNT